MRATDLPEVMDGGNHRRRPPGLTVCTERRTGALPNDLAGEGQKGMPKEAQR